jgi:two-component system copper resistance phosphate regulon response regulator CusR
MSGTQIRAAEHDLPNQRGRLKTQSGAVRRTAARIFAMNQNAALLPEPMLNRPRVLVVEDEEKTRESVTEGLQLEDWHAVGVPAGLDAARMLDAERFDLVILDWMLPDQDGLELLQRLRQRGVHVPVLMLTARSTLADRVAGLETGADDYLSKPFAFAELLARCRALLRRPASTSDRVLTCRDLQLDTRARVAVRASQEIPLTPREVDILEYLMRYQGQIVTREMLERDVWKQRSRLTSLDNVIDVQMMRLRRKVDPEGAERLIQTVRGVGYRFGKDSS